MRRIGFSSGAIACGDFLQALTILNGTDFQCVELSALRISELDPLIAALPGLDVSRYSYVSVHAPSTFSWEDEPRVSDLLYHCVPADWPIIIHPDAISDFKHWLRFGERIAIENMDRRKPIGRTATELQKIFDVLPDASLCFDIGHARQCDPSMSEAFQILSRFSKKLVQLHISEVNSASQHDPISHGAKLAFQQIAGLIPERIPAIIESRVSPIQIYDEAIRALESLEPVHILH